jgi:xanthine dehydrogenase accessory factor
MSELRQILELSRKAHANGEEVCLATVVRVEGSSYRKPGARMLLTSGGHRVGTISGGCLEAEVQKKIWWLTGSGSTVQRYSSFYDEDSEMPYGLGCGGTVYVLLERGNSAESVLKALQHGADRRSGIAIVTVIDTNCGDTCGTHLILSADTDAAGTVLFGDEHSPWKQQALQALRERRSSWLREATVFIEYVPPPPALFIFGAGDDAQPLVEFAHRLGWVTTVIDGRSHLVTRERFPLADGTILFSALDAQRLQDKDAAVILTHSYEQDRAALRLLLPKELAYLGILGPRLRTARLLEKIAPELGLTIDECRFRLHSPVGLDIGAKCPASIALAIIAEIHAVLEHAGTRRTLASAAHA